MCYGTATKASSTSKIIDNIDNIPFFNNDKRRIMSVRSKVDWLKTGNSAFGK